MRETRFIKQMQEKWQEFEQIIKSPYKSPDKLYDVFIQVMNDLSYARTFYSNRSVRVYLNGLAQQIFVNIYKNKKSNWKKLIRFWTDDLPRLVYEAKREFLLAFLLFSLSFLIGVLSSAMDPEFTAVILGDSYVEMTRANIESGDPMAVYKQSGELGMSIGIAGNNLFVAFLTFVLGIFFTIGSMIILVSNGVMVGAFQYFFIEQGLFLESFLTIWIHGTLEISAIIIAGAAGITMGKGLVFPGSFSRTKAFQKSARRGLKIMIGIAPIIILAAFFEGYLTRHTETSDLTRAVFIAINLLFILAYFVVYPRWKAHQGFETKAETYQLQADQALEIEWLKVKSVAQQFGDTIALYRKYFRPIFFGGLLSALLYTGLVYFTANDFQTDFFFPQYLFGTISRIPQFFINSNWWMGIAIVLPLFLLLSLIYRKVMPKESTQIQANLRILPAIVLFYFSIYFSNEHTFWILFLVLPFLFIYSFALYQEEGNLLSQFQRTWQLISTDPGKSIGLFFSILLVTALFFTALDTLIFNLFFDLLAWIFPFEQSTLNTFSTFSLIFLTVFVLFLVLALFFLAYIVFYFATLEAREAIQLKSKIAEIGKSQRIRGMERE